MDCCFFTLLHHYTFGFLKLDFNIYFDNYVYKSLVNNYKKKDKKIED